MGDLEPDSSVDPALKAAVRRVWGAELAPQSLREQVLRIAAEARVDVVRTADDQLSGQSGLPPLALEADHQQVASETDRNPTQPVLLRRRHPWFALAAAAVLLLALGTMSYVVLRPALRAGANNLLSTTLTQQLVVRHDECCAAPDHHMPGLPRDNFIEIGKALSSQLDQPVVSVPLPGVQWVFFGASICPVGQTRAAHLLFKDGVRDVSVFSLPQSLEQSANGDRMFESMYDRHPIAAFRAKGALVCVVGSSPDGSLTLEETSKLRDALMADTMTNAVGGRYRVTVAADH